MIIEMRTYTVQPGSVATVEERFGQALPARAKLSALAVERAAGFPILNGEASPTRLGRHDALGEPFSRHPHPTRRRRTRLAAICEGPYPLRQTVESHHCLWRGSPGGR